jgi:hypothetical protein
MLLSVITLLCPCAKVIMLLRPCAKVIVLLCFCAKVIMLLCPCAKVIYATMTRCQSHHVPLCSCAHILPVETYTRRRSFPSCGDV